MSKLIRISMFALSFAAAAALTPAPAEAGKERCKVYIDGEYKLIAKTYTDGGCSNEARKMVGPIKCAGGAKKFEFKYMFDGKITEKEGYCSNVR